MERSIRIGKDFNVRWSINKVVDGERQPYELAGKELVLQYRTPYGLKEATEWKTEGNTIVWTFRGKEQKALGSYELILTENGGKDGMVTVDTCRAFKLVAHSCEETEGSGSDIVIEDVVLESEVAFAALRGPQGERGPEGPQGPQGERGPQGEQGPAGPSYNDTEIKAKLTELSAETEVLKEAQQFTDVAVKDLQDMKIDRENDDYYPKMAVGLADNLAGVDVVDSEINFRRSGGGAISDGVARIDSIKGNSVVWNQLNNPSLTPYVAQWLSVDGESYVVTKEVTSNNWLALSQDIAWKMGHYYYYNFGTTGSPTSGFYVQINDKTIRPSVPQIIQSPADASSAPTLRIEAGNVGIQFKIQAIDLTKMFGSGNEPTTIEEFYQRIPMGVDLNAYNEGEVIHMDVQSIESVGVNQWDEEWEPGRYDISNGLPIAGTNQIRNKNFIQVMPSTTYYLSGSFSFIAFLEYDANKKFLRNRGGLKAAVTTSADCRFIRFYTDSDYGVTYKGDICINLSDTSINGKYFPYIKRVEDLSIIRKYFPQGMKSAGSAHDEIRYNKASGKWEKVVRIGEVDMGTLLYRISTINNAEETYKVFYTYDLNNIVKFPSYRDFANILTSKLVTGQTLSIFDNVLKDKSIMLYGDGTIYIRNTAHTDVASFKAAMQGVMLYYELAEPIITELDEADQFKDLDYQVWNAGTEKAIAEGKSAPLAADITYGFNAIGKIKELESLVAALRAKVGI